MLEACIGTTANTYEKKGNKYYVNKTYEKGSAAIPKKMC